MQQNAEVQELLAQPSWDKAQRVQYEKILSETIAASFDEQPLFSKYRPERGQKAGDAGKDLTHLTATDGFDCDRMSVMKAIMSYRIEHALLDEKTGGDLKKPTEYYVVGAGSTLQDGETLDLAPHGHAAIVSSATGNVIEATSDKDTYFEATNPSYNFKDFVAGVPFVGSQTSLDNSVKEHHVQLQFGSVAKDDSVLQQRREDIEKGDFSALATHQNSSPVYPNDFWEAVTRTGDWPDKFGSKHYTPPQEQSASPTNPLGLSAEQSSVLQFVTALFQGMGIDMKSVANEPPPLTRVAASQNQHTQLG